MTLTVSVSELRNNISNYLEKVMKGTRVVVCDEKRGINIAEIIHTSTFDKDTYEKYKSETFYKERWIKEDGLEQKLIVTYSLKYRDYQRKIRILKAPLRRNRHAAG